jgi:hypothetical protein
MDKLLSASSKRTTSSLVRNLALYIWYVTVALIVTNSPGWSQSLSADLDGDGRPEYVLPDPDSPMGFITLREEGPRTSRPRPALPDVKLYLIDWNIDGVPDVLTHRRDSAVEIWVGRGDGQFDRDEQFSERFPISVQSLTIADLSGSLLPDLLFRTGDSTIALVERSKDLPFHLLYWNVANYGLVSYKDVNADGSLDILVGDNVRLRGVDGWDPKWRSQDEFETSQLRVNLVGPVGNPGAVGAMVDLVTSERIQRHWVYPPQIYTQVDLTIPDDAEHVVVTWTDGRTSTISLPVASESLTIRAEATEASLAASWFSELDGTHLQWQFSESIPAEEQHLWEVMRSGGSADPVRFNADGRVATWESAAGPSICRLCVLTYAGNPVAVWRKKHALTTLMPWAVKWDTSQGASGVRLVEADDGEGYLVATLHNRDDGDFLLVSNLLGDMPDYRGEVPVDDRLRNWMRIEATADTIGHLPDYNAHWYGDGLPAEVRGAEIIYDDVTGDGRIDAVSLGPDGTLALYLGTDGRPAAEHLVTNSELGPAAPGDTVTFVLRNPTEESLHVTALSASDGLELATPLESAPVAPLAELPILLTIDPTRQSDFPTEIMVVSDQVDGGAVSIPVWMNIGLPQDAPRLDISVDLGVVQRDSVMIDTLAIPLPWIRLPEQSEELFELSNGSAMASLGLRYTGQDTVSVDVSFTARALGDVTVSYELNNGTLSFHATAVDTIAPETAMPTLTLSGDTLAIQWHAMETADLVAYEVNRIDEGFERRWQVEMDTTWVLTGIPEGKLQRYVVRAVDVAGNRSTSEDLVVYRPDRTPPVVELSEPGVGAVDVALAQPIVFHVWDELTPINADSVDIRIDGVRIAVSDFDIEVVEHAWSFAYTPEEWPLNAVVELRVSAADTASPPNRVDWLGTFQTVADTVIPVMNWIDAPLVLGEGGVALAGIELPLDREIVSAELLIRPAGQAATEVLSGTILGREVEFDVPPAMLPMDGFFYQWIVETDRRRYSWPDTWHSLRLEAPSDGLFWPGSGQPESGRALYTPPVRVDGRSAIDDLRMDIGEMTLSIEARGWDAREQRWVTSDDIEQLAAGDAVAISWRDAAPVLQVRGGTTVALDSSLSINLEPGWNLIGQPFPYAISWDNVAQANPHADIDGPWVENEGLHLARIWQPWHGAWIYSNSNLITSFEIPAGDTVLAEIMPDTTLLSRMPASLAQQTVWGLDDSFLLAISAETVDNSVEDVAVGWNESALDQWDALDVLSPPAVDSSLILRLVHDDWIEQPGTYAIDIREPAGGGVWKLSLLTTEMDPVDLRFDFLDELPAGIRADLIDVMTQDSVRLDQGITTYRVRDLARFPQQEFALVIGNDTYNNELEREEALAPSKLTLFQNYPNPFNSETTISYSVPAHDEEGSVRIRLAVYNMLGQHVQTLREGHFDSGVHTASWDGRDNQGNFVSSGVYFCELTWGEQRHLQRMIYVR